MAGMLLVACGKAAPEHYSIDEAFSASEAATIRAAVSDWCDAVGWCPSEVSRSERGHFALVDTIADATDDPRCHATRCAVSGHNDGDNVRIARDRPQSEDMAQLWLIVAHEAGHFCAEHTATGLMSPVHDGVDVTSIDAVAVSAWRSGCL